MVDSDPKKREIKLEYITVFYTWFPVLSFMLEKIFSKDQFSSH